MIEFLYTGEIDISDAEVVDLFTLADQYQLTELKKVCEDHVSEGISLECVIPMLISAKQHTADQLLRKCLDFISANATQVLDQEAFTLLPEDLLIDLLQVDFRASEAKVFMAVVRWGEAQTRIKNDSLKNVLKNVIRQVRFVSIKKDFLKRVVLPMDVLPREVLVDVLMERIRDPVYMASDDDKEEEDKDEEDNKEEDVDKPWLQPRGRVYKTMADFPNEEAYAEYMKAILRPGMVLRAIRGYENVPEGDTGTFVQFNSGIPPCQANWRGFGSTYWLYWRDVEIVEDE